jgi:hypothetical protein
MTYTYPELKAPADGQVAAIIRYTKILQQDSIPFSARGDAFLTLEEILMSLVVDPEAKPGLARALEMGEASLTEMVKISFMEATLNGEAAEPKKAVRRGRPRKSVA